MSSRGADVLRYLDEGYLEGVWWQGYSDRLTPDEKLQIRGDENTRSDYWSPLVRPLAPAFGVGDWLNVAPKLGIRVKEIRYVPARIFKFGTDGRSRGVWEVVIGQVVDYRGGGRLTNRALGEQLHQGTTIVPVSGRPYEPEPEKVPAHVVKSLPTSLSAKAKYAKERSKIDEQRARRSLIDDLRRSDFDVVELEQIRATMERIRQAREVAA